MVNCSRCKERPTITEWIGAELSNRYGMKRAFEKGLRVDEKASDEESGQK
jgi:hypothetical protein